MNARFNRSCGLLVCVAVLNGCGPSAQPSRPSCLGAKCDAFDGPAEPAFEFVVVGAGAGGGPLAVRLARAGHSVLLLEAGEDAGENLHYQVPAFHALASEDPALSWSYFVDHYSDPQQALADTKMVFNERAEPEGILYPRGATLGGSTAVNAMITVYPHESDWDHIAAVTGDPTWNALHMRRYFERVERNRDLGSSSSDGGHGFGGWLSVERADPKLALGDSKILRVVLGAALAFVDEQADGLFASLVGDLREIVGILSRDLNSADPGRDDREGLFSIPLATDGGHRNGPRENILATVAQGYPLTVKTRALVTNVVWSDEVGPHGEPVAIGVEYLDGAHLYRADPRAVDAAPPPKRKVQVSREVILSAGAFNTPQLLMLSGVGPREVLERHGIEVRVDLPGVGRNLQDRYEVGVVFEASSPFSLLEDCALGASDDDPCLETWRHTGGPYATNGAVAGIVKRSSPEKLDPDLFIFGLAGDFRGYEPGYSQRAVANKSRFTWAILKAHTENNGGTVTLRSADPRDPPRIHFRYFQDGDRQVEDPDLAAVVQGVEFVRTIARNTEQLMPFGGFEEIWPGPEVNAQDELEDFVKSESWGHHASCTAKIGSSTDPMAVLDSKLRVRGVQALRVVDASVFPRIPGFFIVTPIYMVSEKAADVILDDVRSEPWRQR